MAGSLVGVAWRWSQLFVALVMVIIEWICRESITIFFRVMSLQKESDTPIKQSKEDPNLERDTLEYIEAKGYPAEEHFVTTPDGYILGLHRVLPRPSLSSTQDGDDEPDGASLPTHTDEAHSSLPSMLDKSCPVLIIHGFMQSSEAFAIRHNASDSLPLVLADAGYDVWLGNNRGNKYSHKHVHKKPTQEEFWDYSLDDLARHDVPSMINYVLARNGAKMLSLIGFSQGTAQAMAYLSNPAESAKVNLFIALAPVSVPRGFANPLVDTLARARPDFIFLLFGKRQLLPSTLFWRNILSRTQFVKLIDFAMAFLFGWTTECLSASEKPLLYAHLYSHTSVKAVVHWFQMIQAGKFQMFDDYMVNSNASSGADRYTGYTLPQYHIGHIRTPVACFCGGRDTLPQTDSLLQGLPKNKMVYLHTEEKYEHLDFMWAKDISQKIYPKILSLLEKYNNSSRDECCEL